MQGTLLALRSMLTALDAVSEQASGPCLPELDLLQTSLVLIQAQCWVDRDLLYTQLVDYAEQHCSELVTSMVYSAMPANIVETIVYHACRVAQCDYASMQLAHQQVIANLTITWNPGLSRRHMTSNK